MLATIMQGVDNTIANVALPHMQGSLSASQDQIAWVLTSYIVSRGDHDAADRLARRPVRHQIHLSRLGARLHVCLGAVRQRDEPAQLVIFRIVQGDLRRRRWCRCRSRRCCRSTRRERHGQAMAMFGHRGRCSARSWGRRSAAG